MSFLKLEEDNDVLVLDDYRYQSDNIGKRNFVIILMIVIFNKMFL